jgi:putative redox protein
MTNEIRVQLRQVSAAASEATMGPHRVLVDRPVEKNGTDQGPMGGQLFLASVGGCFMSNLLAAVKARGAEISNVQTEVTGVVAADAPARFTSVELFVSADGDREILEKLVEIAQRSCIMVNTLQGALELTVRISVPA